MYTSSRFLNVWSIFSPNFWSLHTADWCRKSYTIYSQYISLFTPPSILFKFHTFAYYQWKRKILRIVKLSVITWSLYHIRAEGFEPANSSVKGVTAEMLQLQSSASWIVKKKVSNCLAFVYFHTTLQILIRQNS